MKQQKFVQKILKNGLQNNAFWTLSEGIKIFLKTPIQNIDFRTLYRGIKNLTKKHWLKVLFSDDKWRG